MAKVPVAPGNLVSLEARPQALFRAADNGGGVGGAIGRGLQQAGGALAQHVDVMDRLQDEIAEVEAKEADNLFATTITDAFDNPDSGLRNLRGKAAIDAMSPTLERLSAERSKVASGLNQRARQLFDRAAQTRISAATQTAYQHAGTEKRTWLNGVDEDAIKIALSDAGNAFANPALAQQHIATAMLRLDALADREQWAPEQKLAKRLELTSGTRRDIAERLAMRDPELAERYKETFKDELLSDDAAKIENDVRAERNRVAAERRRAEAELRQEQREERVLRAEQARDLLDMMDRGDLDVPAGSVEQLASRVEADRNPVLALRLRTGAQVASFTSEAKAWRPDQLQGWINEARVKARGGGEPIDGARISAAEKLLGDMTAGLKSDPLSWAVKAGVATLAPLDIGNPAATAARTKTALGVAARYGGHPVFLTDEETATLAGRVASAKPQGKLQLGAAIAQNFGRHARTVLGSLAGQDPVFAHASALATMGPYGRETAMRIFTGQEALKDKATSLPPPQQFELADGLGGAMRFKSEARGATMMAAKAIYAADALAAGFPADHVDEDAWQKALNRAAGATYLQNGQRVGGIAAHRGLQIVLPSDISPDEFPTLLGRLDDGDLKAWGASPRYANGKPVPAATLRSSYLFDAGSGRYYVSIDRGGTQFVQGDGGRHFILDVSALAPRLRGKGGSSRARR